MSEEIKLNEDIKKVVKTPLIITSAKEMKRLEQENERFGRSSDPHCISIFNFLYICQTNNR